MREYMRKKLTKGTADSLFGDTLSFVRFYEGVAQEFGLPVSENTLYDCRKILVAKNIMTRWLTQCEELYGKWSRIELAQKICILGPKASEDLEDNEVEIEKGFVT